MNEIDVFCGVFDEAQTLPIFDGLRAGFPSPAADYENDSLDFNRDFIQHPNSTFYARVVGDSMSDAGIAEGDILVVDKSLEPQHGDVVVAYFNREFTIKYYDESHRADGYIELVPANKKYSPIHVDVNDEFTIWGVVCYSIKPWRGRLVVR